MENYIIHCDAAAFARRDVLYMTRIPETREVMVAFKRNDGEPLFFTDDDADSIWDQYINPPFRAGCLSYTPLSMNGQYGWSSPMLPPLPIPASDYRSLPSGWVGSAMPSQPSELTPTVTVTPTVCSSYLSRPPNGLELTDTTGVTTLSAA